MALEEALYWYGSIFVWLFFTGIGLPPFVPEEAGIIYASVLTASHPAIHWYFAWPATVAGIVAADMALYGIGRFWGKRLFKLGWVNRLLSPKRRDKIQQGFRKHGLKILLSARLLPTLRTGVFITAGAMRYNFLRFMLADALYAIVAVALIFFGCYFFAEWVKWLLDRLHEVQNWIIIPVVVGAGGYGLYRYIRYVRAKSAKDDVEPPSIPVPGLSGITGKPALESENGAPVSANGTGDAGDKPAHAKMPSKEETHSVRGGTP